ncbi:hypothetical protein QOZ80_8AG0635760 [Eleusine coracana subsp. coracana]|nr:hypothetical protein QOZ80_8AG0635760 [Eleusine coracana subsp. coracana]
MDVIQERTPAPRQPMSLAFVVNYHPGGSISTSAYVIDDLEEGRCNCTELWRSRNLLYANGFDTKIVGTCNGLLCLCDKTKPGGAISLLNPVTGETLAVPPLPGSAQWGKAVKTGWHEAYSFGYDPVTERYKVVHLPCYFDQTGGFNVVHVFTLGEASWRDVPVPGSSCCLNAGIVSIDGATYWITNNGDESVVSFNLKEERVVIIKALPKRVDAGHGWHLTEVHGRLGLVSSSTVKRGRTEKIEVWVLGDGKDWQGWSRRYSVQVNGIQQELIMRPHLAHGDYVLLTDWKQAVYWHRLRNAGRWQCGEVRSVKISEQRLRAVALIGGISSKIVGIFSYVKTTMDDPSGNLPTDAFVEILLRLHPIKRWRLRLVCRRWCDVIQDRTPAPSRPLPLAFVVACSDGLEIYASAYVVEDLKDGRGKEIWRTNNPRPIRTHDPYRPYYSDDVTNRFDTRMWPRWGMTRHEAYSLGYDAMAERYTCRATSTRPGAGGFNAVQVFSPGAPSWRDVPVPGGSCCLQAGIVCVDGATCWITKGMEWVVSLDLREEKFAFTKSQPKRQESGYTWHLTAVRGQLGVVCSANNAWRTLEKIEAWVLEDGKEWSRRYSVQVHGVDERIARPHFAHGDHVLLTGSRNQVYGHKLKNTGRWQSGKVRSLKISEKIMPDVEVSGMSGKLKGIFSYVKNAEPFSGS